MARCLNPRDNYTRVEGASPLIRSGLDGLKHRTEACRYRYNLVPCGKCYNCLKNRQKRYAGRLLKQAQNYCEIYFLTLTYAPEHCPFCQCLGYWDEDTGEWVNYISASQCEGAFLDKVRKQYSWKVAEGVSSSILFEPSWSCYVPGYFIRVTPSLCREDIKLIMKQFRIDCQRANNDSHYLDGFKYSLFGEYGKKTHRPHYHAIFMGVSRHDVDFFCSLWNERFGFSYLEVIPVKPDKEGESHARKVALYISKYVSKGNFDETEVNLGFVEKPRLQQSQGIGEIHELEFQCLKDFYLCKDILQYDETKFLRCPVSQRQALYTELLKRMYMTVDGVTFPLPVSWKHKFYYKQILIESINEKTSKKAITKKYLKLPVFASALNFMAKRELSASIAEFKKFVPSEPTDPDYSAQVLRFKAYKKARLERQESFGRKYVERAFELSQF